MVQPAAAMATHCLGVAHWVGTVSIPGRLEFPENAQFCVAGRTLQLHKQSSMH